VLLSSRALPSRALLSRARPLWGRGFSRMGLAGTRPCLRALLRWGLCGGLLGRSRLARPVR